MGRNSELIRQWTILQQLAARRTSTIPALSADLKVSTRTIRRDLEALQASGFPIYDEVVNGTKFWRLDAKILIDGAGAPCPDAARALRAVLQPHGKAGVFRAGVVDYCFVAPSTYIPRIQEAHATLYHTLIELTRVMIDEGRTTKDQAGASVPIGLSTAVRPSSDFEVTR